MPDWSTYIAALPGSKINQLLSFGNLTFYKDYSTSQSVDANYASGSTAGTFTAIRTSTNPATYIDTTGLIIVTTASNVARFTGGFYDDTGFVLRPGLIIEGTSTNRVPQSQGFDDASWVKTNINTSFPDFVTAPDGTLTADLLLATSVNATCMLSSTVTAQTFSVFLKPIGVTGPIQITANAGSSWTSVIITDTGTWYRVQVTASVSTNQTCGIRIGSSGDAIYAWGGQFEALPFASTYIPTTGNALTRNEENLSYLTSGNRTGQQETGFVTSSVFWQGTLPLVYRFLDSDADSRSLWVNSDRKIEFRPNGTVSPTSATVSLTALSQFTKYVIGLVCDSTGNPNSSIYLNGVVNNTNSTDYTVTSFGTNFYVGNNGSSNRGNFGIFENICFFSDEKSSINISSITNILNL